MSDEWLHQGILSFSRNKRPVFLWDILLVQILAVEERDQ